MSTLEFLRKYKKIIGIYYLVGFLFGLFFCPWDTFSELILGVVLACTSLLIIIISLMFYGKKENPLD